MLKWGLIISFGGVKMAEIITNVLKFLTDINLWEIMLRAVLAVIAGGVIGLERGKQGRAAGMRTHILVCLGAALTAMTGEFAVEVLGNSGDMLRVSAQVISGIGFLGVGTILLKGRFQITGLTTAAGLWAAATLGIALGIGFYVGAIVIFLATVTTVTLLHRFEYRVTHKNSRFGMYVELNGTEHIRKTIDFMKEEYHIADIQVTPPRTGIAGNVGIEAIIHAYDNSQLTPERISEKMESFDEVVYAIESI